MDKNHSFTLKDIIYIVVIIITLAGAWYKFDKRMTIVEIDNTNKTERIKALETEIQNYRELPQKLTNIENTSNATLEVVGVIRDALIAERIIKPGS